MKSYYVAKTTTSGFIGTFTFDQIESLLKSEAIKPDYVATECSGPSFNQLVKSGVAIWLPVSQLHRPIDTPTAGTAPSNPVAEQQPVGSNGVGCAVFSTSTLLGVFFGGLGGLVYLLYLFSKSIEPAEANFLGVGTVFALLQGGFVTIVSAVVGALVGALTGITISVLRRKR